MANLTPYNIALGDRNYPATNTAFLNYLLPYLNEIESARGGQSDVLARIQQCMVMSVGFTQDLNANGNRLRGLPVPVNPDEPATKSFAEGLAFSTVLPAQSGSAGGLVFTDGSTASWSSSQGVTINYLKRASRRALLSFIK